MINTSKVSRSVLIVIIAISFSFLQFQSLSTVQASQSPSQQAVALLNKDRVQNGLEPLAYNQELTSLAEYYALDMMGRNFFAHNDPEGLTPFDRMQKRGITYRYAGENLALNDTIEGAQAAFMNSSTHRANVLNPNFTSVGIGVKYAANGKVYVVQEFIGQ